MDVAPISPATRNQTPAVPAQTAPEADAPATPQSGAGRVDQISVPGTGVEAQVHRDDRTGTHVVEFRDNRTGEVVNQLPAEAVLAMSAAAAVERRRWERREQR